MTPEEEIASLKVTIAQLDEVVQARNQQINQLDGYCRNLEETMATMNQVGKELAIKLKNITSTITVTSAASQVQTLMAPVEVDLKEHNGVTRPKSGVTEQVWALADTITTRKRAEGGFPATKAEVVAVAKLKNIKESTAGAAYSAWCKFFEINAKDTSKPYVQKEAKAETTTQAPEDTRLLYLMHPESSSAFCGYRKELDGCVLEIGFVEPGGPSQQGYLQACAAAGVQQPFPFDMPPPASIRPQGAMTFQEAGQLAAAQPVIDNKTHELLSDAIVVAEQNVGFAPPPPAFAYLPPPPPPAYG